jgi:hypothetical protein
MHPALQRGEGDGSAVEELAPIIDSMMLSNVFC